MTTRPPRATARAPTGPSDARPRLAPVAAARAVTILRSPRASAARLHEVAWVSALGASRPRRPTHPAVVHSWRGGDAAAATPRRVPVAVTVPSCLPCLDRALPRRPDPIRSGWPGGGHGCVDSRPPHRSCRVKGMDQYRGRMAVSGRRRSERMADGRPCSACTV